MIVIGQCRTLDLPSGYHIKTERRKKHQKKLWDKPTIQDRHRYKVSH
jgi:hypothetical protein